MNRLTFRCGNGNAVMDCVNCDLDGAEKCTMLECRDQIRNRLADYEDIGLLPWEIEIQLKNYSAFLSEMTGGKLSKTNYTVEAMVSCVDDYREMDCSMCPDRRKSDKYRDAEEHGSLMVLDRETALAIAAGWRAIRTTKRFQGASYVYDPLGEDGGPYEIPYSRAAEILCNIWDKYPLDREEADKEGER